MARSVIVDIDLGYNAIISEIIDLGRSTVVIGFQEGTVTRSQVKNGRKKKAGLNLAQIAAQNEFGTETIPQRSFMRTAFDENFTSIEQLIGIQYGKILDQKQTVANGLSIIGLYVEGLIKKKIRQIVFPPNSPRTIAEKGSSKPLIDFGQMVNSVRFAIRKRGSR